MTTAWFNASTCQRFGSRPSSTYLRLNAGQPVSFEGFFGDIRHRSDGLLEQPIAFHGQDIGSRGRIGEQFRQVVVSLDGMEQIPEPAIGLDVGGQDAAIPIPALEHDGSGTVAQQNTGAAVFPVHDRGEPLGSDDQHMLGLAQADAVVGLFEGVDESRTTGGNIEGRRIVGFKFFLDHAGGRGEQVVGGYRGHHDGIDLIGRNVRHIQGFSGSCGSQVAGGLLGILVGNASFLKPPAARVS